MSERERGGGGRVLTNDLHDGSLCSSFQLLQFSSDISFQIPIHLSRRQIAQVLYIE